MDHMQTFIPRNWWEQSVQKSSLAEQVEFWRSYALQLEKNLKIAEQQLNEEVFEAETVRERDYDAEAKDKALGL